MPMIDVEVLLRMVSTAKEEKVWDRRRYSRLGDVAQIHIALGGEEMCEVLERRLQAYFDRSQRLAAENDAKRRRRVLRDRQRQLSAPK